MKQCRSEGDLRSYLDRELPPEEAGRVLAHLAECGTCAAAVEELAARAARVSALLDELSLDIQGRVAASHVGSGLPARDDAFQRHQPGYSPALAWRRWASATAALAACLAMAFVLLPRRGKQPERPAVAAPAQVAATSAPPPSVQPAAQASRPVRPRTRPRPRQPEVQYFLALDDDPFEVGVVRRVALGPAEVPADVVFSPDGRARAIRLVNYSGD